MRESCDIRKVEQTSMRENTALMFDPAKPPNILSHSKLEQILQGQDKSSTGSVSARGH